MFSLPFKVCVAPTVKDSHETKCSLNFGSRAMKVQVTAHVNYEVDYKKLAEALAAKLEALGKNIKFLLCSCNIFLFPFLTNIKLIMKKLNLYTI